jgi:ribulose-phosphate 3-epimerase
MAPSLLSADFAKLGEKVTAIIDAGADLIHFDVMGKHCMPNLTMRPMVCQAIRPYAKRGAAAVPIDVHLMVKPVDAPSPPSASMRSRAVP